MILKFKLKQIAILKVNFINNKQFSTVLSMVASLETKDQYSEQPVCPPADKALTNKIKTQTTKVCIKTFWTYQSSLFSE